MPLSVNHNTHYLSSDTIRVSEVMTLEVIQPLMAVAQRNGFHFVGVIQQAEQIKGEWIDHNSYAKVMERL